VSLANHARTRCHDDLLRPRCYVAVVKQASTGQPLRTPPDAHGLVRARLVAQDFGQLGELGALYVAEAWAPAEEDAASGGFFRLRDMGIRCVRAPCFAFRASRLNERTRAIRISSVDLTSALDISAPLRHRALAALGSPNGLLASGRIAGTVDGGRLFTATQAYLEQAKPRA
jgi:hypothetical protein